MGKDISAFFPVTKGLRQGCVLAPTLFKLYLEASLVSWRRKCSNMDIQIGNEILYTLLFADDQVLIAEDEDDASYMVRKLKEKNVKWGLEINFQKTEYLAFGEGGNDLILDNNSIRNTNQFKHLFRGNTRKGRKK